MRNVLGGVAIEERLAQFAIRSHGVVLAIVANAAGHPSRTFVNSFVEVTGTRVIVTDARSASVRLLPDGRFPRQIVVKVLALLAVQSGCVVSAFASTVHHVLLVGDARKRKTPGRVAVARTGSADHDVLDSVVVFLAYLRTIVEKVVSKRVQSGHVYAKVRDFQVSLHFHRVWVVYLQILRQYSDETTKTVDSCRSNEEEGETFSSTMIYY